ncbi:Rmnd1 [Symbiodinium natans]|uniref:Rmnd1 protein n=1 Tax=Symbiodinium natans TaxID=878477 RepID=A0A812RK02_9DINO|nr:Rmnd1 [Symbiodinium natans]
MARGTKRSADAAATETSAGTVPEPSDDAEIAVPLESCEDENHRSGPEQGLRRRRDGIVRCARCHEANKRKLMAVGTRGLDLAAHFRMRRSMPGVEVVPSSPEPEADDEMENAKAEIFEVISVPQTPVQVRRKSAKGSSSSPDSMDDETTAPPSESSDGAPPKVLHIGCDVCPRWYVVDQLLFDHWREEKFTCCMIGERCGRKDSKTALVSCPGVPEMCSRMGRPHISRASRPHILPLGFWDLWRPNTALSAAAPKIFAAPVATAGRQRALEAQQLLTSAFEEEAASSSITLLLGLRRKRAKGASTGQPAKAWLLWQDGGAGHMVSAAILSWQRYTTTGPKQLQGGVVLEYIARLPECGAKAYHLILAAEEVALLLGQNELFSACDLTQDGCAFDGRALPALAAHQKWGFQDTDQKEWRDRRLEAYNSDCNLRYMVKRVGQCSLADLAGACGLALRSRHSNGAWARLAASRTEEAKPGKQVWAHLLARPINLSKLGDRLSSLSSAEYSCRLWRMRRGPKATPLPQVLICDSKSADAGSAVVLADGCLILWDASADMEQQMLQLAASCPADRRGPTTIGAVDVVLEGRYLTAESSEPVASESIDFVYQDEVSGSETRLDQITGQLRIRAFQEAEWSQEADREARLEQIAISLGMDVAVRLEALETKIERKIQEDWKALEKEMEDLEKRFAMFVSLKDISNRVFKYEKMIHQMRYELNAEGRFLDSPDLLWENHNEERIHDQVVKHFDVKRRTELLNERLSYSLDFLHTLGEHVRHLYSVRLERMIIILITLELGVGVMGLLPGMSPHAIVSSLSPAAPASEE